MHKITFEISGKLQQAMSAAPKAVAKHLSKAVNRAGQEVAREKKRQAPKANSTLTHSIQSTKTDRFTALVAPTVGYAHYVVSSWDSQKAPPSPQTILDWVKVKGITPNNPKHTQQDLAFAIANSIQKRGVQGNDFVAETADVMRDRVSQILTQASHNALKEVGLL